MADLKQLQKKHPKAKYEPDENCKKCEGKGEFWHESTSKYFKSGFYPCHCVFISRDFLPVYREVMSKTLSKIKAETSGG